MKTHKEINKLIANLAGDAEIFEYARHYLPVDNGNQVVITKNIKEPENYSADITLAIDAAKRIADKNNYTFVLTYIPEESHWKASFGDWKDCAEYKGFNPAYCVCMSILEFMGKL